MGIRYLILFLVPLSNVAFAKTQLDLFYSKSILLPDNCYFISRGGHENDFMCPTEEDRFRSITFPLVENVRERSTQENLSKLNESAEREGMDYSVSQIKKSEIEGLQHYLSVWTLEGIEHHLYTVCDHRACIAISATEVSFVRSILQQFSEKTLYGLE